MQNFTGVSAPYDIPKDPQIRIPTDKIGMNETIQPYPKAT
ncbi:MAG: hypothetical protein ISS26_06925 [Candidatus Omnitrophica bacterium]|nr:hypothetical protein [Candidatus Omnitrophota bacterium]